MGGREEKGKGGRNVEGEGREREEEGKRDGRGEDTSRPPEFHTDLRLCMMHQDISCKLQTYFAVFNCV